MPENAYPGTAVLNAGALIRNFRKLKSLTDAIPLAIVKADAYGHGAPQVVRHLLAEATWFGIAQVSEALDLLSALGDEMRLPEPAALGADDVSPTDGPRLLTWIASPGNVDVRAEAIRAGVDVTVSNLDELTEVVRAATQTGLRARVHMKVDVGNSRAGCSQTEWPEFFEAGARQERAGNVTVVGIWSHLQSADDPRADDETDQHVRLFEMALKVAAAAGVNPQLRHLAATSGGLWHPQSRFDMVRWGIGIYGMSPNPARETAEDLGLEPVMTLRAPLMSIKRIPAGQGVSYNATWSSPHDTYVGLVPLGYGDGIPRAVSNRGYVTVNGQVAQVRAPRRGRVCMDQFVVELGHETNLRRCDDVEVFGSNPPVDLFAQWADTINYEVVTRLGPRVPRVWTEDGYNGKDER